MSKISIIEVHDNRWDEIIARCYSFDFYHTREYHLLEQGGRSLLLLSEFDADFIAMPIIVRCIPETALFDFTSAYGYCGPLSNKPVSEMPYDYILGFQKALVQICLDYKIVTGFARLHPIIISDRCFMNFGEIIEVNKTVAIDLQLSPEQQKKQYRKSNKSELNQLRRKGFIVEEAITVEDIEGFVTIYHETMHRVDASGNYFFSTQYFHDFMNARTYESKLLLAKIDGEIAAGALFTVCKGIMQYHLAGTTERYIRDTPMKLILDEARLFGNSRNEQYLHLGGGVGGNDDDSLFRFKSGFSECRFQFRIWKMVFDQKAYAELTHGLISSTSYFPAYRAKV